jgi:hypothetical protein
VGRLQLFEFNDQAWLPDALRGGLTDFLAHVGNLSDKPYEKVIPKLRDGLEATGETRIIDLCAGSGGPTPTLASMLVDSGYPLESVLLTDLYPDGPQLDQLAGPAGGLISAHREPVDATSVPRDLRGFRTICNAFHHFDPEMAHGVLQDCVRQRQGVCVLELNERSPMSFLGMLLAPLSVALFTPFIKPFQFSRLFWTYVLPLIPLLTLWDGIVSCFRIYSTRELRLLVDSLDAPDYHWEIGRDRIPGTPAHMIHLVGYPHEKNPHENLN